MAKGKVPASLAKYQFGKAGSGKKSGGKSGGIAKGRKMSSKASTLKRKGK